MQADAIRVAILKKYGGIWMDADTIILNGNFIKEFRNFELAMIGIEETKYQYIGFIYGTFNSSILNEWLEKIINNVKIYRSIIKEKNDSDIWKKSYKKVKFFNYLGNGIIDPILKNITGKKFFRLSSNKINPFPERNFLKDSPLNITEKYRLFYFQKRNPEIILKIVKHIILLHNSWTPKQYKNMTETEFLNQDILLSKLSQSYGKNFFFNQTKNLFQNFKFYLI